MSRWIGAVRVKQKRVKRDWLGSYEFGKLVRSVAYVTMKAFQIRDIGTVAPLRQRCQPV
jgi:hypothetical protein